MKHRNGSSGGGPLEIGVRLRMYRGERNLTLAHVSELTGVSVSSLSKIENQQVSPSFDIIKKICDGMRIGLEELVRGDAVRAVLGRKTVTRKGEAVAFRSKPYDYRAHATELSLKGMVPLEIVVKARSASDFDHWSQHRGEEFVYVLSGAIEVHTEHYAPFALKTGESTYFDSGMAHIFVSVGKEDAHILSVSHDPQSVGRHFTAFTNFIGSPETAELEESG